MEAARGTKEASVPVVGLGASAGGIAALQSFFEHLPPKSGMAFVVVLHLSPDHESQIASILQRRTTMPVVQVTASIEIEPDHVYVIPPESNLSSVNGRIELLPRGSQGQPRAPIDLFLRTLAETHGPTAAAIILSGTGSDGTQGIRRIKEAGGLTLAQDPTEAEHDGMPLSAIRTGMVDRVRSSAELGGELMSLIGAAARVELPSATESDATIEESLRWILRELRRRTGHDFTGYKQPTILRRLRRRMQLSGLTDLNAYSRRLRNDAEEVQALHRDLLITVTGFFRDPEAFAALARTAVPKLFERRPEDAVRVWVAGCATGEEAYSVAILLHEQAERQRIPPQIQVLASDPSERAFNVAREGFYPEGIAADVSEERLEKYFTKESAGYRVRSFLRESVLFASHDILTDPPFSRVGLVVCRNVMIYLQRDAQRRALELFHYALAEGGYLFLGSAESAGFAEDLFEVVDGDHRIYRRRPVSRRAYALRLEPRARPAVGPLPDETGEAARESAFAALHQRVLELYAPPSLIVNDRHEVVHLSEHVGRYLRLGAGQITGRLFDMIDGELKQELRTLLFAALSGGAAAESGPIDVEVDGRPTKLRVRVRPIDAEEGRERHALVIFDETAAAAPAVPGVERASDEPEVERLRAQLRRAAEDQERIVQEYQATNEELQSTNEEQRATSEELETSKEEIESVNEELKTLNQEYRSKIEQLAELNADQRNLIDSTDIATLFLDRAMAIRRFTPTVTEYFNFRTADIGRPLEDVTNRLDYPELVADARSVLATLKRLEREVSAEGDRWVSVRISPYRSVDDRIEGVVLTLIDATERKQAAVERERALEEARSANLMKTNFLGVLSHDFRTPLNGLFGYCSLLRGELGGPLTDQQRIYLTRIEQVAEQLMGMVTELLEYARVESGATPVHLFPVAPRSATQEAVDMVRPLADAKGLYIEMDLADDVPRIQTDPLKLRQILINLIGNAVNFTDAGHITLRLFAEDGSAVFEVEDTGIGIAPENAERVFERFWQVESGPTRKRGGSGLGLSTARQLARLLGGDLTLESQLERGSVFRVKLPLAGPPPS